MITDPMVPEFLVLSRKVQETNDTWSLTLETTGFQFQPGQFNMLYAFGIGESAISISGDTATTNSIVHTIRAVGSVTKALCAVDPGDFLGVRGPFGSSWPVQELEGRDVVLVAGGIGLAPLRPVLYHLLNNRGAYGRVALLYGTRRPRDLLYREEMARWRGRFDLEVGITVDTAAPDWRGPVGPVTDLISRLDWNPDETSAVICGPEIMMHFTIITLEDRGLSRKNMFISMERNMKCAVGFCGHCQLGPEFICKDGPVFPLPRVEKLFRVKEL